MPSSSLVEVEVGVKVGVEIIFRSGVGAGGKMNWRIRLTSAKIEVEAELGKNILE